MPVRGWYARYAEVAREFGYSRALDARAARELAGVLRGPDREPLLRRLLRGRAAAVVGAGPSARRAAAAVPHGAAVVAADSAVGALRAAGVAPHVVATDLDGDAGDLLWAARRGAVMVVHAHGDNAARLGLASSFPLCVGTSQGGPAGGLRDYGGFTDGDRCVFMAEWLGAASVTLLGMDLRGPVGRASRTARADLPAKMRKLRRARLLLEWLAPRSRSALYAAPSGPAGFEALRYADLGRVEGLRRPRARKGAPGRAARGRAPLAGRGQRHLFARRPPPGHDSGVHKMAGGQRAGRVRRAGRGRPGL